MSLYNMLFGVNSNAGMLLVVLGFKSTKEIPRFRDCYIDGDHIVIHTRTGGGNRDYYESEESCRENCPEYFNGEDEPSGPWNEDLRKNPYFVRDQDDDFDATYADFYFRFPDEFAEDLKALAEGNPSVKPSDKWQALFQSLGQQRPEGGHDDK